MNVTLLYKLPQGEQDKEAVKAFLIRLNPNLQKVEKAGILDEVMCLVILATRYSSLIVCKEPEDEPCMNEDSGAAFGEDKESGGWFVLVKEGLEYGGILCALWRLVAMACACNLEEE